MFYNFFYRDLHVQYIAVYTPQRRCHLYAQARESKRPRMRTQMKTLLKGTMADAISN